MIPSRKKIQAILKDHHGWDFSFFFETKGRLILTDDGRHAIPIANALEAAGMRASVHRQPRPAADTITVREV